MIEVTRMEDRRPRYECATPDCAQWGEVRDAFHRQYVTSNASVAWRSGGVGHQAVVEIDGLPSPNGELGVRLSGFDAASILDSDVAQWLGRSYRFCTDVDFAVMVMNHHAVMMRVAVASVASDRTGVRTVVSASLALKRTPYITAWPVRWSDVPA